MNPLKLPALLLLLITPLVQAQAERTRAELIDALMMAETADALEKAIAAGKAAQLPEQLFLEARFIYLVNVDDLKGLAALAPTLTEFLPKYRQENTMTFATREDFASITEYTLALAAFFKEDTAGFKKHITEAFWLSPAHGSQFAPHINAVRVREAMKKVTLPMDRSFPILKKEGETTTLTQLRSNAPAILLQFWTPALPQSLNTLAEVNMVAQTLEPHGIPLASFLLPEDQATTQDARHYLAHDGATHIGAWLADLPEKSLTSQLRISSFPIVVLVSPNGKILFNGDPADKRLWDELKALNPKITPPLPGSPSPQEEEEADKK